MFKAELITSKKVNRDSVILIGTQRVRRKNYAHRGSKRVDEGNRKGVIIA